MHGQWYFLHAMELLKESRLASLTHPCAGEVNSHQFSGQLWTVHFILVLSGDLGDAPLLTFVTFVPVTKSPPPPRELYRPSCHVPYGMQKSQIEILFRSRTSQPEVYTTKMF